MACQTKEPKHNFLILQGETWTRDITLSKNKVPVDLTGYEARMYLKRELSQATPDLELTTANGRAVISDPTNGVITLLLDSATTDTLSSDYFYDLEVYTATPVVKRVLQGQVSISPAVTT